MCGNFGLKITIYILKLLVSVKETFNLLAAANCINNLTAWLPHGYSNHPGNLVVSDCIKNAKSGNHKITAVKFNPGEAPW